MPSPFPGMDPYIESQRRFHTFQTAFINAFADLINEHLPAPYFASVEDRVLLDAWDPDDSMSRPLTHRLGPDVAVAAAKDSPAVVKNPGTIATLNPRRLPQSVVSLDQPTQKFIMISGSPDERLVTTVELLSPINKRPGSDRDAYLLKRADLLRHGVNVIDLDLLMAGRRIPLLADLPPGDFFAMVTRAETHDRCDVYNWSLRDPLPTIPIPLFSPGHEVPLDLAAAFSNVYQKSHYDRMLHYEKPLVCPMSESDRGWAVDRVEAALHR